MGYFKAGIASRYRRDISEIKSMEEAARHMDRIRAKLKGWSGVKEIRKWRERWNYHMFGDVVTHDRNLL